MFCGRCGSQLGAEARFCSSCGAPALAAAAAAAGWQGAGYAGVPLTRPRGSRMIAGVCAGLAQHYGWELTWVRIIAVLAAVFSSGAGVVAYIVFWIVMPQETWRLTAGRPGAVPTPPAPPAPPVV